MADFNLIPSSYVMEQHRRRLLFQAALLLALLLMIFGVGLGWAMLTINQDQQQLTDLRERRAISVEQQKRLGDLRLAKESLQRQALLLESLRSGANMVELVKTIEQAIAGTDVWFLNWRFLRSGILVEDELQARPPSYFILTSTDEKFPNKWHNLTRMTIEGEAKDHAALSKFVKNLFTQPIVDDVRVQRSTQGSLGVGFSLAVVVKTAREQS